MRLILFQDKYYNKEELTRFDKAILIMTLNKKEELRKVSKGDEMLMKVTKKLKTWGKNQNLSNI